MHPKKLVKTFVNIRETNGTSRKFEKKIKKKFEKIEKIPRNFWRDRKKYKKI